MHFSRLHLTTPISLNAEYSNSFRAIQQTILCIIILLDLCSCLGNSYFMYLAIVKYNTLKLQGECFKVWCTNPILLAYNHIEWSSGAMKFRLVSCKHAVLKTRFQGKYKALQPSRTLFFSASSLIHLPSGKLESFVFDFLCPTSHQPPTISF